MNIIKNVDNEKLVISVEGRLDTITAPELETVIDESIGGVTELIMDCEKLDYVSSAGLRIILSAQKTMNKQGEMKLVKVNADVMEVFEITGFVDILTIE